MMNNIFNHFDPKLMMINPFIIYMIMTQILFMDNKKSSKMNMNKNKILSFIIKESSSNLKSSKKNSNKMMNSLMIMIMMFNLSSLLPFSWTMTAQLSINIQIILTMFMMIMIMSMNFKMKFMTHLTPKNAPLMMIPMLNMIELTSIMIRPITLTLRLTANLTTGHILTSMINKSIIMKNNNFKLMMPMIFVIMIMESMISMIQAYILSSLISIYISEV